MKSSEKYTTQESRLIDIISEQLNIDEAKILRTSDLEEDLGADSLDLVELIMVCEEHFDCDISDEEAEPVKTVQDAFDFLKAKGHSA